MSVPPFTDSSPTGAPGPCKTLPFAAAIMKTSACTCYSAVIHFLFCLGPQLIRDELLAVTDFSYTEIGEASVAYGAVWREMQQFNTIWLRHIDTQVRDAIRNPASATIL
jgi:hypothetical protein